MTILNLKRSKFIFAVLAGVVFLSISAPIANAAGLISGSVEWAVEGLASLFSGIFGILVAFGALLLNLALALNSHITNSPVVLTGMSITLALANLGFVIALIIIAVATMFGSQTYGMKNMFWKLVVAAVLVNFSLLFAKNIIGFSDSFTSYFIDKSTGTESGSGYADFASKIGNAFNPKRLYNPDNINGVQFAVDVGDSAFRFIGNLIFIMIFNLLIAIVLFLIVLMLTVRYLYLSALLILMPLAWMAWALPGLTSHWAKWWSKFIKWTFFAPMMVLFLYISVFAVKYRSDYLKQITSDTALSAPAQGLQRQLGREGNFFDDVGQMFVVLGLAVLGVFVANSMSITGAGIAVRGAGAAGNMAKGYMFRQSRRAATAPLRSERMQTLSTRLQDSSRSAPARYFGRMIQSVGAGGVRETVDRARKKHEGLSDQQSASQLSSAGTPDKIAIFEKLLKNPELLQSIDQSELEKQLNGKNVESEFARYNQKGLLNRLRAVTGINLQGGGDGVKTAISTAAPQQLADSLFGVEEKLAKQGLNLGKEAADRIKKSQVAFVKNFGAVFSPAQLNSFFQNMSAIQMDQFFKTVVAVRAESGRPIEMNDKLKNWLDQNPAKALGITPESFGLPPAPEKVLNVRVIADSPIPPAAAASGARTSGVTPGKPMPGRPIPRTGTDG